MSDQDDWDFAGADEAKVTIRAAVRYLLKGTAGGARGDIVQEIIMIVRNVATGESSHSLDDGLPDPFDDAPGG
jgi:hypothetical protein